MSWTGVIENSHVQVRPFQRANLNCCSVAPIAQAACVPVMATPVTSRTSGTGTRDHDVPDRRRASGCGQLWPFGMPPTAQPPLAVAVTALRKPGMGAGRVTAFHALPFQCSSSVCSVAKIGLPVYPRPTRPWH